MINKAKFPDGGFVLHKIEGNFKGRASAWFDVAGKILDAEVILPSGRSRSVNLHGINGDLSPLGAELARAGRIHL